MPCQDSGPPRGERARPTASRRLNLLTRVMCSLLTQTEHDLGDISPILAQISDPCDQEALTKWWEKHKREDKQRLAREAASVEKARLKKEALALLSEEHKRALGIST